MFFSILTCKCASRQSGVPFFHSWTPKSGPMLRNAEVFCIFWLANVLCATAACHFNGAELQKWPEGGVFCTFWLANVLRATAAANFHFSCDDMAPRRFSEPTFPPTGTTNHGKTQPFAAFLTFRGTVSPFYWLSRRIVFFLLSLLPCSAFHLSIFKTGWRLWPPTRVIILG